MPRFYFHLDHAGGRMSDEDGCECGDFMAARAVALKAAADITADEITHGREHVEQSIIIADEGGSEVLVVRVQAAVAIEWRKTG